MQLCMRENLYKENRQVDKNGLKGFGHSQKMKIGETSIMNLAVCNELVGRKFEY